MPTRRHIILLSGLFLGLFLLPFSAKAQEENYAELLATLVTISGNNVFCAGEHTAPTTFTATIPFAYHRFEWSNGNTTDLTITIDDVTFNQTFSIQVFDSENELLGQAQRSIFVTTRPTVTPVNELLCVGENRAAIVGMNTTANHFSWSFDPAINPHLVGDPVNQWTPPPTTDFINVHIWYQVVPNRVVRTVLDVKISEFPIDVYNLCYTQDSAIIEIEDALFELVASETSACIDEIITLNIVGGIDANTIVWSTGQVGGTSTTVQIVDIGDTIFSVRGTDLAGCQGVSYVSIFGMPSPENVHISIVGDDPICEGLPLRLTVDCDDCASFLWITGHTSEEVEVWPIGRFTYTVRAFGGLNHTMCYSTAELEIVAINCEEIHFPTAIRLSSQIGNNVWRPVLDPLEGTNYWFAIFNQWGQLIFESNDMEVGWDGTHNGQFVRPGTFVFLFRLTHIHRTWERTGTITVID